jgi:hypothetical protein
MGMDEVRLDRFLGPYGNLRSGQSNSKDMAAAEETFSQLSKDYQEGIRRVFYGQPVKKDLSEEQPEVDLRKLRKNIGSLKDWPNYIAYSAVKSDLSKLPEDYRKRFEGPFYKNLHDSLYEDLESAMNMLRGGQFNGEGIHDIRFGRGYPSLYESPQNFIKGIMELRREISELSEGSHAYANFILENAMKYGLKQEARGIVSYLDYLRVNNKDLSNTSYFEFCKHLLDAAKNGVVGKDYIHPAFEFMEKFHSKEYCSQKEGLLKQLSVLDSKSKNYFGRKEDLLEELKILEEDNEEFNMFLAELNSIL